MVAVGEAVVVGTGVVVTCTEVDVACGVVDA